VTELVAVTNHKICECIPRVNVVIHIPIEEGVLGVLAGAYATRRLLNELRRRLWILVSFHDKGDMILPSGAIGGRAFKRAIEGQD
jgi:hypothetical protein